MSCILSSFLLSGLYLVSVKTLRYFILFCCHLLLDMAALDLCVPLEFVSQEPSPTQSFMMIQQKYKSWNPEHALVLNQKTWSALSMSDAGWLLFFPLFSIWRVLTLLRELWWLQFYLHYSLYQECVFEVKPLIAPACCALLCTIKWSLRAGLNWNESKMENILPRANMHSAHGSRLQLVWHHTSNSPSHPEWGCHFLSINLVSLLVLLCFPPVPLD